MTWMIFIVKILNTNTDLEETETLDISITVEKYKDAKKDILQKSISLRIFLNFSFLFLFYLKGKEMECQSFNF